MGEIPRADGKYSCEANLTPSNAWGHSLQTKIEEKFILRVIFLNCSTGQTAPVAREKAVAPGEGGTAFVMDKEG